MIVNVNDRVERENRAVALHAGLVGVAQDDDGALRPVAGWYLAPGTVVIAEVVDRIVRDHFVTPPQPESLFDASSDVVAVYSRIGSATLFDGAWKLRPIAEHRHVRHRGHWPITAIIDLADGRSIGSLDDSATRTTHWILCRIEDVAAEPPYAPDPDFRLVDDPGDIPVYGTSLAQLLDAALDSGGDIAHLETGRLDQLDRAGSR